MDKKIIEIQSFDDSKNDIEILLKIATDIIQDPKHSFTFEFDKCSNLGCCAIALLGAIAHLTTNLYTEELVDKVMPKLSSLSTNNINDYFKLYLQSMTKQTPNTKNIGVLFNIKSMSEDLKNKLIDCDFLSNFVKGHIKEYPSGNYIGFRIHNEEFPHSEKILIDYLENGWLAHEKIKISPRLKSAIVGNIVEIFQNSFGHGVKKSKKKIVISCGAYYEKEHKLSLCIVDLGMGIVKNVQEYMLKNGYQEMSTDKAFQWALTKGNTTKTDSTSDIPRGIGLDVLREFVTGNKGKLDIYSNGGHVYLDEKGEYEVHTLKDIDFPGTMVLISINCREDSTYSSGKTNELDDIVKIA